MASSPGVTTPTLQALAWSGSCDRLAGGDRHARRTALWQLGVARPALKIRGGDQLALELPLQRAPDLPALSEWEAMIANYEKTGISIDRHPLGLLREQLTAEGALTTADLAGVRHNTHVKVGGFVIARQKPQTANGITFLLIEDEHGTLNVIVPRRLYEQHRTIVRTAPIIRVDGVLERHADGGGAINLLANAIHPLHKLEGPAATVTQLPRTGQPATPSEDFAVVASPAMNFAQGRHR